MRVSAFGRPGPLAVIASNAIVPVGVFAFGWSITVLLGVFLLELAVILFWTAVKIPFATKRPNNAIDNHRLLGTLQAKRGEIELPGPLPPVYLRNVPTLFVFVFLLAPLELGVAFVVFALPDPTITTEIAGQMILGGICVFSGRSVEVVEDYFLDGRYRDHSPRSVMLSPFKAFFGIGTLLFIAGPFGVDSGVVLAVIVAGKLIYDLRSIQVGHDEEKQGLFYRLYGSHETEIPAVPVVEPDGEPRIRVRPRRLIAVTDALYRGITYTLTSGVLLFYAIGVFLILFAPAQLVFVPLAIILIFATLRTVSRYLRYGTLEYHCYPGVLVAYDTLLDEPQARIERSDVSAIDIETDFVDRVFSTVTVEFDRGDDDPTAGLTVPDPENVELSDTGGLVSVVHTSDIHAIADVLGVAWQVERDTDQAVETR